ncbi:hypothetical protein DRN69_07325 [Candidatus Pacearchaeota archaeon]|nr:MAG: hypothetical protein DRN69_07325 [Candidatus Pacearchaeota archaeon]
MPEGCKALLEQIRILDKLLVEIDLTSPCKVIIKENEMIPYRDSVFFERIEEVIKYRNFLISKYQECLKRNRKKSASKENTCKK